VDIGYEQSVSARNSGYRLGTVDIGYEQWIISVFVPVAVIGLEAESL
jgi:hypothetical protein